MAQRHSSIRRFPAALLLAFACLCPSSAGLAQDVTGWGGPDTSDGYDWLELTSGEWLKGDMRAMQNDRLEFDSDKLGLLKLDWEDVRQVVTDRTHSVRSEDRREYSGALRIDERTVSVIAADGTTHAFDRVILLSIIEGERREINYWSFKLGAGVTLQRGNTEQTDLNLLARIQRRTPRNRLKLEYLGLSTTVEDVQTAENHRVNGNFDVFLSRRLFLRPLFGEYYRDDFQNLAHRATVGSGVGYTVVDSSRIDWDVTAGLAYQYTQFASVPAGESREEQTPSFVAGTAYTHELTDWLDLFAQYDFMVMRRRSGTYTHHAIAGLEIELTSILDLDLAVVWDRIQDPQMRDDGTRPKPDDLRFILGVSLDY